MAFIFTKFNRQIFRAITILVLIFLPDFSVESQVVSGKKMLQTKKTKVAAGRWGGTGIGLNVEETAVNIEFDCATAEISRNLMIDQAGNFSTDGIYIRRTPGALRLKFPPKRVPASFEGKISGKTMTLRITLTETGEKIGDFTLQLGKTPAIRRCA
jgi:hypothetical protein